jgi:chromatin remodeling complex protein RSC6
LSCGGKRLKPIIVKIPDNVLKLPVHEALIEMLNIAREQAEKEKNDNNNRNSR